MIQKKGKKEKFPGVQVAKKEATITTVKIKAGEDDGNGKLHNFRFEANPVTADYKKFFNRVPTKHKHVFRDIPLDMYGCNMEVAHNTVAACNFRNNIMMAKHFLPKNSNIDSRVARTKTTMKHGVIESVLDEDYIEPQSMTDMLSAITNYMSINHCLWPLDYTGIVILKVYTNISNMT